MYWTGLLKSLAYFWPNLLSKSRSIFVSMFNWVSKETTHSVLTFPVAFLAYGHPPKPPIEESITVILYFNASTMFSKAFSLVSWKCTANKEGSISLVMLSNRVFVVSGVPTPIVSPSET